MAHYHASLVRKEYHDRIGAILAEHKPEKLGNLDNLLDKYAGEEHGLYLRVCSKYKQPQLPEYFALTPAVDISEPPLPSPTPSEIPVPNEHSRSWQRHVLPSHKSSYSSDCHLFSVDSKQSTVPKRTSDGEPLSESHELKVSVRMKQNLREKDIEIQTLHEKLGYLGEVQADNERLETKKCELIEKINSLESAHEASMANLMCLMKERDSSRAKQSAQEKQLREARNEVHKAKERVSELSAINDILLQEFAEAKEQIREERQSMTQLQLALSKEDMSKFSLQELMKQDALLCSIMADIAKKREEIQEAMEDANLCTICCESKKECVLAPCGHSYCHGCAHELQVCAFCKQRKTSVIKVFW